MHQILLVLFKRGAIPIPEGHFVELSTASFTAIIYPSVCAASTLTGFGSPEHGVCLGQCSSPYSANLNRISSEHVSGCHISVFFWLLWFLEAPQIIIAFDFSKRVSSEAS